MTPDTVTSGEIFLVALTAFVYGAFAAIFIKMEIEKRRWNKDHDGQGQ